MSTLSLGYAHRWTRTTILQPCLHRIIVKMEIFTPSKGLSKRIKALLWSVFPITFSVRLTHNLVFVRFHFALPYCSVLTRTDLSYYHFLKVCQRYATAIRDITARTKPTYDWCGVDLNHTWLSRLSSSKLPVSTNYLTAIAFTYSATHQQGESQIWTDGHRFAVCCLLPLGYFAIYN